MADLSFTLDIITPDGVIYKDDVNEVMLPTPQGQITILPHHIPLFAKLIEGEVIIKKNGKEQLIAVLGGVLEVGNNMVSILSDYAVSADTVVIAKATAAKERAEQALKNKEGTQDYALIDRDLKRSILDLKVAQKVKKYSSQ